MMKIDYDKIDNEYIKTNYQTQNDDDIDIYQEADYFGFSLDYAFYQLEKS